MDTRFMAGFYEKTMDLALYRHGERRSMSMRMGKPSDAHGGNFHIPMPRAIRIIQ